MVRALAITARGEEPAVQDVDVAEPGSGQVRVAVEAASVNGFDAGVAAGYFWDVLPHEFPVVLGRDFAGTVEAAGDGVTGVGVGDRVAGVLTTVLGVGAIAGAVTVDSATLVAVPAALTAEQAAAVGLAATTAHDILAALSLTPADTVLVSGATGGVGAFVVQMAAAAGATVLATARPGEAADFVRGLGAHHVVDYSGGGLAAAVRAVAPEGVTAVVHAAGDAAALAALLRPGGRLASVLGATGAQAGRDDVTVTQIYAAGTPGKTSALLDAAASGALRVPVAQTYGLDQAARALSDFGGHKLGKLVVTP